MPRTVMNRLAVRRLLRVWHFLALGLLLLGSPPVLTSCSRYQPTWQPSSAEANVPVYVYATGRHTVISLPSADPQRPGYEDWAYGQMVWFYEDRFSTLEGLVWTLHRVRGVFRALFWPSAGVVEIIHEPTPLEVRRAAEVHRNWTFHLSPANAQALRDWLERSIAAGATPEYDDGTTRYILARDKYHMFHTCHHWAGRALRAGGLPVDTWRCVLPGPFWSQLIALERVQTQISDRVVSP